MGSAQNLLQSTLIVVLLVSNAVQSTLEAYTGSEPTDRTSPIFSATLTQQGSASITPHVYYDMVNNSNYNCSGYWPPLGTDWYDRTISWIEFGQQDNDITTIEITQIDNSLPPLFNNKQYPVRILPKSYNITQITVNSDYKSISFQVKGNFKSLSVEFGEYKVGNKQSNFMNSLLIFVGDLSPNVNNKSSNVLYFGPGVHNITEKGGYKSVLTVPQSIDTIYLDRGSYVYGKINDNNNKNGILNIIGYGILDGSYFDYCNRYSGTNYYSMIQSQRAVNLLGLTVYNPSWFMTQNEMAPNSIIKSLKGIGWYINQDCVGVGTNGIIENTFCRTADDAFKFETGNNITLRNNVDWQLYNGDILQMGWFGVGCVDCVIRDIDIIHAEWRYPKVTGGSSMIGLRGWTRTAADNCKYSNILFENIRIDTPLGRVIGILMQNCNQGVQHILENMTLRNIVSYTELEWTTDESSQGGPPSQYLTIQDCSGQCVITGINFDNIVINGSKIMNSDDKSWNLKENNENGQTISNITYS